MGCPLGPHPYMTLLAIFSATKLGLQWSYRMIFRKSNNRGGAALPPSSSKREEEVLWNGGDGNHQCPLGPYPYTTLFFALGAAVLGLLWSSKKLRKPMGPSLIA